MVGDCSNRGGVGVEKGSTANKYPEMGSSQFVKKNWEGKTEEIRKKIEHVEKSPTTPIF